MIFRLTDRRHIADETLGCWLKPTGHYPFHAGQYADFTFADPPCSEAEDNVHTFSLASAPGDEAVMIATRVRDSGFKQCLADMPVGSAFEVSPPDGEFVLHEDATIPAVFLTGGIGITPVRSIVDDAVRKRKPHAISVFYANRTVAGTAFLEEFERWSRQHAALRFVPTLTGDVPAGWAHERGRIDAAMLRRHLPDVQAPIYYLVGPPAMVEAMKALTDALGIPKARVFSEDFAGY